MSRPEQGKASNRVRTSFPFSSSSSPSSLGTVSHGPQLNSDAFVPFIPCLVSHFSLANQPIVNPIRFLFALLFSP